MSSSHRSLITQYFFRDLVSEFVFLPMWWYTRGLTLVVKWFFSTIHGAVRLTGLGVWAKNLFVPMYGETGAQGRLISFFIRLIMIFMRGIASVCLIISAAVAFVLYLVVLPLSVAGIIYSVVL